MQSIMYRLHSVIIFVYLFSINQLTDNKRASKSRSDMCQQDTILFYDYFCEMIFTVVLASEFYKERLQYLMWLAHV
ncbi:hypothetical protein GLOIN_2v1696175 [Rhizophagus irregularis DAOM 181602=DAOM 197198]|uniref:Uncharacterized protein n=1 Tax=Rhizophagus irregularis (strain DAOM 181602 / DAOM 197198 / MUCL 43194) TaxID=747089 RepID=A0A2P4PAN7_RHIID|nr:hypothetical protein GLOIN_2v1696175 [Rhizophagus irregularis DAOM 181602=DAOM 197198]POG62450.1 hypothetical protein GLOIN_2v1696175 [Rhizophagus irregularis DAOM 181602=DAOM 197198]GET63527.1 hypothetical protein GLOIN_2v1696175 [Rhizophagus irregularis DAOM 181602=DAOM 197198]|eukprot:XP_025169316.1 hypothetical protein GLOIN_2v1696175 [Rhizophagus irregularis DAOM 181602=DAOM 197198]